MSSFAAKASCQICASAVSCSHGKIEPCVIVALADATLVSLLLMPITAIPPRPESGQVRTSALRAANCCWQKPQVDQPKYTTEARVAREPGFSDCMNVALANESRVMVLPYVGVLRFESAKANVGNVAGRDAIGG